MRDTCGCQASIGGGRSINQKATRRHQPFVRQFVYKSRGDTGQVRPWQCDLKKEMGRLVSGVDHQPAFSIFSFGRRSWWPVGYQPATQLLSVWRLTEHSACLPACLVSEMDRPYPHVIASPPWQRRHRTRKRQKRRRRRQGRGHLALPIQCSRLPLNQGTTLDRAVQSREHCWNIRLLRPPSPVPQSGRTRPAGTTPGKRNTWPET
jgi:hypothetical protein